MKKGKKISFYLSVGIFIACLIFMFFINYRKNHFKEISQNKTDQLEKVSQQNDLYLLKSKADELFIAGEYDQAMELYHEIEDSIDDNRFIESRKATVARFNSLRSELDSTQNMTSYQLANMEREMDKKMKDVEQKYKFRLDSVKNHLNKKIATLTKTIKQKEIEIQNKAELGRLTYYNANGTKIDYFGEVKFGKANGEGVGHYSSNSVYDGSWKNNMKHGVGTYKWADGNKYVGEYKNDKRSGKGTYYWNTGEKYVGQWENDRRNGQGTLYDKDGIVKLKGEWKDDELVQ